MEKYLRYKGEFLSRAGVVWRVEILQDATSAFAEIGELTFEADEALTIEWKQTSKEEPVCGSTATLRIDSPGDRTYQDLYTIVPGRIRMDVYRNDSLYWSGALDPEFYEEPYEKANHYPVSLTFSDFGILDRLKYDLSGMQTMEDIIEYAMGKSGINYGEIKSEALTTTYFDDEETKASIAAISVRSDNFTDEEGEQSTLREVLEGLLQPLSLRIIQRAGNIHIYDLNGLYNNSTTKEIKWDGDSSTMGTDKVYNNAVINFSPYSAAELVDGEVTFDDEHSPDMINRGNTALEDGEYFSYYPDYSEEHRQESGWDYDLVNFTIFLGAGSGLAYLNPNIKYFHIEPQVGGPSECDGVAWGFYTGGHGSLTSGYPKLKLKATTKANDAVVMRTHKVFIPKLSSADAKSYYIRLSLEMLLDARYNPFTEANNDANEDGNYKDFKECTAWAFVPVAVTLYDGSGNATYHYDNSGIAKYATGMMIGASEGKWSPGAASFGDAWLEYYAVDDQKDNAGILGWKANRHTIGRPDTPLHANPEVYKTENPKFRFYDSFRQMPDGQYIPYPPQGGYLEVTVYAGVNCYDYREDVVANPLTGKDILIDGASFETTLRWTAKGLYDKVRWLLYKVPKIEVVKNNLIFDKAELDDVEYSGYLNTDAKEEISIDTICGTSDKPSPTARGIYYRTSDSLQLQKLHRAGVTDHPEKLLIGTLYSQFADRRTTLQGECTIEPGGITAYSEVNQGSKKFIIAGETQDLISDTSDVAFIEFRPDEYEASN